MWHRDTKQANTFGEMALTRLAWGRVAKNLQFVKSTVSVNCNKANRNKASYAYKVWYSQLLVKIWATTELLINIGLAKMFKIFHNILLKNPNELFGQPDILDEFTLGKMLYKKIYIS